MIYAMFELLLYWQIELVDVSSGFRRRKMQIYEEISVFADKQEWNSF